MDIRYFNYINLKSPYYSKNIENFKNNNFTVNNPKKCYKKLEDGHWVNYLYKFEELPDQGWKIHISTLPKNAQEILDIVSKQLFKENISFKFVKNYQQLIEKNSKYANRIASGKFITIYPQSYEKFIYLLNCLKFLLEKFPLGPYILTDKRWYDSNVYFRYGAFKPMYYYENNRKVYAIKDPDGVLIEDSRKPYYTLPYFIKEPLEIKKMDEQMDEISSEISKLANYTIDKVLHYSNGGGVYLAKDKKGRSCVIKEGRLGSGLDILENDAFQRIQKEAECLFKLVNQKHPVKIYDFFKEWEHNFIVEEYIEGETLNKWIVNNYPFYSNKENSEYKNNALIILDQLYEALCDIHNANIGLGDLSPNNIIISENNTVRLIDLETADTSIYDDTLIGLNTLGFASDKSMNREKADWFSLLRIARFIFLPIGPIQDISLGILQTHDDIIKDYFGKDSLELIEKIENICKKLHVKPISNFIEYSYENIELDNITEMKERILSNLYKNLLTKNKLILGDIRQHEIEGGEKNILTGDYGMVLVLNRIGTLSDKVKNWSVKQNIDEIINMDESLFLGKTGIATALWENGEKDRAKKVLNSLKEYQKISNDITITSGLAGIGLAFIGFSYEKELYHYLMKAIEIGEKISTLLKKDFEIETYDIDITNIGLMNGWSGVSLFFSALYKRTENEEWLILSEVALKKDIERGHYNNIDDTYHLDDIYRLMPYLDGGSAGVGLAIIEFNLLSQTNRYSQELNGIKNLSNSKIFYNVGLFRGSAGIIDTARAIDKYNNQISFKYLNKLKSHLIFSKNEILTPGEFNYRLSNDLFSGSLGILLVLEAIKSNINFLWLPIPNIKKVFCSN